MKVEKKDRIFAFLFGGLVGLILFYKIYGYGVIGITNVEWLLSGGELTRGYLGWVSYRNSSWHFPLWLTDNLVTGESVSLIYTGSVPLFAIIFKLFRSILPTNFQYFGLYGFICFILQGGLSAVIFRKYTKNYLYCALGAVLMIICPVLIEDMFTDMSFASHFIIIVPIYLWVYREEFMDLQTKIYLGLILGVIAVFVSYYFFIIMAIVLVGYAVEEAITDKKIGGSLVLMVFYGLSFLLCFAFLGGFHNQFSDTHIDGTMNNANMNALWNTNGFGTAATNILQKETGTFFLKGLSLASQNQHDGFAYLGLGIIFMLIGSTSIYLLDFKKDKLKDKVSAGRIFAVIAIVILTLLLSFGSTVTFGNKVLLEIHYDDSIRQILEMFKHSGRYMIVIVYIITMFGIINLIQQNKPYAIVVVLLGAILLQSFDIQNVCGDYSKYTYTSTIQPEALETLGCENVIIMGSEDSIHTKLGYDIAIYAVTNNKTINMFPLSRSMYDKVAQSVQAYAYELETGTARPSTIYMFIDDTYNPWNYPCLTLYQVGELIIGVAK